MARAFGCNDKREPVDDDSKEMPAKDRINEAKLKARAEAEHRLEMGQRVADLVVNQIKRPLGFHRADGHHLWGEKYRVNIYTAHEEQEQTRLTIAKSFFVESNGHEIIRAVPELG